MSGRSNSNNRFNRRRYPTKSRRKFVTRRGLRTQMGGIPLIPRVDPPRVLPTQWNTARLVFFGTKSKLINETTIQNGIRTQLMLTEQAETNLTFRIKKAYCWISITDGNPLKAPLQCRFHSVYGEGFLSVQSDYGGEVSYARCGYLWPLTDRQATLRAATDVGVSKLIEILPVDPTQIWTCMVDILWAIQKPEMSVELDGVVASRYPAIRCDDELSESLDFCDG